MEGIFSEILGSSLVADNKLIVVASSECYLRKREYGI